MKIIDALMVVLFFWPIFMVVFSKWDIVYMYYLVSSGIIIHVKVEE